MQNFFQKYKEKVVLNKIHDIEEIIFEDQFMLIHIDQKEYKFDLTGISKRLLNANSNERSFYEVFPSGYGVHWPLIDEDLSIDGLLKHCSKIQKIS
jgi:hypothetical protein